MKRKLISLGVVSLIGLAVFLGWLGYRGASPGSPEATAPAVAPEPKTVAVARGDVRQTLVVPVEAVTGLHRTLSFLVEGRLAELAVQPGDTVEEGQVLARLEEGPFREALARAKEKLKEKRAELARLRSGPSPTELLSCLPQLGLVLLDFLSAQDDVARLKAVLSFLSRFPEFLGLGPDEEELWKAEEVVKEAEEEVERARADLEAAVLRAPFPGTVLAVEAEEGERVSPGTPVLELADLSRIEARATVVQEEVGLVQPGQAVLLRFDPFPEREIRGRVSKVLPRPVSEGGVVTYAVLVSLETVPDGLLPGMTGDAEIVLAERRDVLVLPRRAIRAHPNSTVTLKVLTDHGIELRTVRIGLVGDLNAEVLSGLEEGERVVVER